MRKSPALPARSAAGDQSHLRSLKVDFDRHFAIEPDVSGAVNHSHPAGTQLVDNLVVSDLPDPGVRASRLYAENLRKTVSGMWRGRRSSVELPKLPAGLEPQEN